MLPQRKSPRLPGYDYRWSGAYFITINTKHGAHLFGEIIDGEMFLNSFGEMAANFWQSIPQHYAHITVDAYVVMPNHVHGVLFAEEKMDGKAANLGQVVGSYKSAVTSGLRKDGFEGEVWHSRYYDHIIRTQESLERIRVYIAENPRRWIDRNHVDQAWLDGWA